MENWRLSRIEEELGKLKLDLVPPTDLASTEVRRKSSAVGGTEPDAVKASRTEDDILSNIVIRPAYKKASRTTSGRKTEASKAVRQIKEKYDSPNAVTKTTTSADDSSTLEPNRSSAGAVSTPTGPPCSVELSPTSGVNRGMASPELELLPPPPPPCVLQTSSQSAQSFCEPATFVGRIAHHEYDSMSPPDDRPRLHSTGKLLWPSRPGPPTAAKPSSSTSPLSPIYGAPSTLPVETSWTSSEASNHRGSAEFNHRPSTFNPLFQSNGQTKAVSLTAVSENGLSSPDKKSPVLIQAPGDLYVSSSYGQSNGGDGWAQGAGETRGYHPPDLIINGAWPSISSSATLPAGLTNSESAYNHYSSENHLTTYQNHHHDPCSYPPHFGTMKAQQSSGLLGDTARGGGGDCMPPYGSCLTDEDRHQVELFYRSHKTRVFVSRCEANLYFGSARRHSVVLPSRKQGQGRATNDPSAENWTFVKCGIPVLVLDTGESRRQRRLHVIVAERGSGFVLWRDTIDHLTNYSACANAGFHTMHLSKDHTKLAGLYFADPLSASDFFDYLNGLTSNPDDPLLDLSNGARKKKDLRRHGSKKKKEKRKPIRPEDISLPCCFNHVTKLDRNDGLNIISQSDQTPSAEHLDKAIDDSQPERDDESRHFKTSSSAFS